MSKEENCSRSDKQECHCLSCRMAVAARRAGEEWAELNQLRAERDALVEALQQEINDHRLWLRQAHGWAKLWRRKATLAARAEDGLEFQIRADRYAATLRSLARVHRAGRRARRGAG